MPLRIKENLGQALATCVLSGRDKPRAQDPTTTTSRCPCPECPKSALYLTTARKAGRRNPKAGTSQSACPALVWTSLQSQRYGFVFCPGPGSLPTFAFPIPAGDSKVDTIRILSIPGIRRAVSYRSAQLATRGTVRDSWSTLRIWGASSLQD